MVLLCRPRTNKIDVYPFPICFVLVSKVVSVHAALRGPTADTVHASTETPSLLTPIASVRNVFTVGVERSIGPALFLEVEFQ